MIVHIYNRGVDKRKVFIKENDYKRFVEYLYLCNSQKSVKYDNLQRYDKYKKSVFEYEIEKSLVGVGAWCLMPNHFHLIVSFSDYADLAKFMQKLTTAYTMFFNKKYDRTGALFAGTYKQKLVNEDGYYDVLWNYVHLNPLELFPGNTGDMLHEYKYSSLVDFINMKNVGGKVSEREEVKILNLTLFPEAKFKSIKEMKSIATGLEVTELGLT